jgi:hypothetical protein
MSKRRGTDKPRLTYANVMSTVAVFLALGGATAFAATQVAKKSVGPSQLKKNAVTTAKIKNNAVTKAKIRAGAVDGSDIGDGTVGFADLGAGSTVLVRSSTGALGNLDEFPYRAAFNPPVSFTAQPNTAYMALLELRSNLFRKTGVTAPCDVIVLPTLNGQLTEFGNFDAGMEVTTEGDPFPESAIAVTSYAVPLGLAGGAQELGVEVTGDNNCDKTKSTVTVNVAVLQLK